MTWEVASRLPLWALAVYALWLVGMPLWVATLIAVAGFTRGLLADEDDLNGGN